MPASATRSRSSVLVTSFRSGSPAAFARNSRRPPNRSAPTNASWASGGRGPVQRTNRTEHGNDGGRHVDATFGAGGYSRAILATPGARVIGIDRDHRAIAGGAALLAEASGRLELVEDRFANLDEILAREGATVDGVVFDLGVSSMQLDEAERGFSFRLDGPLDMRMGRSGPSAADVVARADERDLAAIIFTLGEERHARAIARAIGRARAEHAIDSTGMLAEIVARAVRARPGPIHPATRTFQALRIFVNDELAELAHGLAAAERVLKPDGRLVVIAFHSLEDRIVKNFLNARSR